MKCANVVVLAGACAIELLLSPLVVPSAHAQGTPQSNCVSVSRDEYLSAKQQKMLRARFGSYVRTGRPGRRYYWYCHP